MDIPLAELPEPKYPPIVKKRKGKEKKPKTYLFLDELLPKKFKKEYFNKK